jgi:hypothetical protein
MKICKCGKEHNGTFGSLCEDCWADVQGKLCIDGSDALYSPYKSNSGTRDQWEGRTPRQKSKMGMGRS